MSYKTVENRGTHIIVTEHSGHKQDKSAMSGFGPDKEGRLEAFINSHPREHGLALVIHELRREYLCTDEEGYNVEPCPCEDYEGCLAKPFIQAIRVLEDWSKKERHIEELEVHNKQLKSCYEDVKSQLREWAPLIEAAGKVDKQQALHTIVDYSGGTWEKIRALFAALPDEKEP